MAFRGFLALNGTELANSSRVITHLGRNTPTNDAAMFTPPNRPRMIEEPPGSGMYLPVLDQVSPGMYDPAGLDEDPEGLYFEEGVGSTPCALVEVRPGLYEIPADSVRVGNFWSPPNGSRRYGPGMFEISGRCWEDNPFTDCRLTVGYDDSWDGLQEFLGDTVYRPELAPWYTTRVPEAAEFAGVWLMDVQGLDTTAISRPVTELVGSGAVAGQHRDTSQNLRFEALLIASSNAGLTFGLNWLSARLRETKDRTDSTLRFFAAHPGESRVIPDDLVREIHGVVYTKAIEITDTIDDATGKGSQASVYRVTWEMVATKPYAYMPLVNVDVEWDTVSTVPINWVHAGDCAAPETCEDMEVLFSEECTPEVIEIVTTPPPSCGGCLPVCAIREHVFSVPTLDTPLRGGETAVTTRITNTGSKSLTFQLYWRRCNTDVRCEDNRFPLQVTGLPATATLILNGISGRYWVEMDGRKRRPVGIVGTPNGGPWRPPVIDRSDCWELVAQVPGNVDLNGVRITLADRQP